MNKFTNPYQGEDGKIKTPSSRLNADILTEHYDYVRLIRPSTATITTVTSLLWTKMIQFLKDNNITCYADRERFEQYLANCVLVLPGGTTSGNLPTSGSGNVPTGEARVDSETTEHEGQHANVARKSGGRGKR